MLKNLCMLTALSLLPVIGSEPVAAKAPPCSRSEMSIPDERGGGRKICLKKKEWAKARKICGPKVDPLQCICQDGSSVGACGN